MKATKTPETKESIGEGMLLFIKSTLENVDLLPRYTEDLDTLDSLLDSVEADLEALLSIARAAQKYDFRSADVRAIERLLREYRRRRYDVIAPDLARMRSGEASKLREEIFGRLLPLRRRIRRWMRED